ncbi:MAG: class I tRNA ligase family protein, partial [Planctomycetota bacterium]
ILLLTPLAPHMAEELWQMLGNKNSIHKEKWPTYNHSALQMKEIEVGIQINGKIRSKIIIPANSPEEKIKELALADNKVQKELKGQSPKKIIVIPGRLINIVS